MGENAFLEGFLEHKRILNSALDGMCNYILTALRKINSQASSMPCISGSSALAESTPNTPAVAVASSVTIKPEENTLATTEPSPQQNEDLLPLPGNDTIEDTGLAGDSSRMPNLSSLSTDLSTPLGEKTQPPPEGDLSTSAGNQCPDGCTCNKCLKALLEIKQECVKQVKSENNADGTVQSGHSSGMSEVKDVDTVSSQKENQEALLPPLGNETIEGTSLISDSSRMPNLSSNSLSTGLASLGENIQRPPGCDDSQSAGNQCPIVFIASNCLKALLEIKQECVKQVKSENNFPENNAGGTIQSDQSSGMSELKDVDTVSSQKENQEALLPPPGNETIEETSLIGDSHRMPNLSSNSLSTDLASLDENIQSAPGCDVSQSAGNQCPIVFIASNCLKALRENKQKFVEQVKLENNFPEINADGTVQSDHYAISEVQGVDNVSDQSQYQDVSGQIESSLPGTNSPDRLNTEELANLEPQSSQLEVNLETVGDLTVGDSEYDHGAVSAKRELEEGQEEIVGHVEMLTRSAKNRRTEKLQDVEIIQSDDDTEVNDGADQSDLYAISEVQHEDIVSYQSQYQGVSDQIEFPGTNTDELANLEHQSTQLDVNLVTVGYSVVGHVGMLTRSAKKRLTGALQNVEIIQSNNDNDREADDGTDQSEDDLSEDSDYHQMLQVRRSRANKSRSTIQTGYKHKCGFSGCNKMFKAKYDLTRHIRTHARERPFVCSWNGCNKSFSRREHLNRHYRIHTGERPYLCDQAQCGKSFIDSSKLIRHRRTHTRERPFVCGHEGCDASFTRNYKLVKHRKSIHKL